MIGKVIHILCSELNRFLKSKYQLNEDLVLAANLADLDGNVPAELENRIVLTVVNIEQDTNLRNAARPRVRGSADNSLPAVPAVQINLHILVSAFFRNTNYLESLKFLSEVISFFHQKPIIMQDTTPELAGITDKLTVEMLNLSLDEVGNLWGRLGAKHLPSVVYRVRMR